MNQRVLIVDDDPSLCDIVSVMLRREGYETRIAYDGPTALEVAETWEPNLVLLDIMMPGMDGFEVLRQMRRLDETMTVPIVMLTAVSDIQGKETGFRGGADDYVVKPFNNTELKLRVEAHLRRYNRSSKEDFYIPQQTVRAPFVLTRTRSGIFRRGYLITKRLFDITACLLALPFALPLMLLIAILVRLDSPGPIIFIQQRTGMSGKRFKMYKFRTMVKNAEELKEKYRHLNELTWPDFKITNDPRVTRVGRFLRKSSLDEVPQLINILKGDMSFVGPRPTSFAAETYDLWQTERLEVRPGLTGLWQIKGRSNIDFDDRVELDIEYIERASWELDLAILFQTFAAVVAGQGAS